MSTPYVGRFAPSPTGPLHFGTLITATASYLQARSQQGEWLLRIEDVDTTRAIPGMDDNIIKTLAAFGFEWDGEIIYQTQRTQYYEQALQTLSGKKRLYPCTCSRKTLAENPDAEHGLYPGTCRERKMTEAPRPDAGINEWGLRILVDNHTIEFQDRIMGTHMQSLDKECGDFVVKRRDGLFAYQLAVVVDDSLQGVTEVVRGSDLLDSTPRQIYLQQQLGYEQPAYLHLPLVIDQYHQKISKSAGAAALDQTRPVLQLCAALRYLGQKIPVDLEQLKLGQFWDWAIKNWNYKKIPKHNQPLP